MTSTRGKDIFQGYKKPCRWESGGKLICALSITALLFLAMMSGCASTAHLSGPTMQAQYRIDPWDAQHRNSKRLSSANYRIYTDIRDADVLDQLVQVMEGAHQQYQAMCPSAAGASAPLRCFLFSRREEWAAFTTRNAGTDAPVYLRINRGAYAINDWFVAFWLGDRGTFAVAAHEGWHQFVARHYAARMPPALEEGVACMFENISWTENLPRWDLRKSRARSDALLEAIDRGGLWPLQDLVRLHAGDVIKLPRERIDTFYGQTWALARFLLEERSPYRRDMGNYLAELASGKVYRPAGLSHLALRDWNPGLAQPQLEHYLGKSLAQIEPEYLAFCAKIAQENGD